MARTDAKENRWKFNLYVDATCL